MLAMLKQKAYRANLTVTGSDNVVHQSTLEYVLPDRIHMKSADSETIFI